MKQRADQPDGVDNYGDMYWKTCTETGVSPLFAAESRCVNAYVPGVRVVYVAHTSYTKAMEIQAVRDFYAFEANCNTCKHLIRVPQAIKKRQSGGMLYGRCGSTPINHPYQSHMQDGIMAFPPDDHMNMSCYSLRWAQ